MLTDRSIRLTSLFLVVAFYFFGNIFPMGNKEEPPHGHFIPVNLAEKETISLRTYSRKKPIVVISKNQINGHDTPSQINEQSSNQALLTGNTSKKKDHLIDPLSSKADRIIENSTNSTNSTNDPTNSAQKKTHETSSNTDSLAQEESVNTGTDELLQGSSKILYRSESSHQAFTEKLPEDLESSPSSLVPQELLSSLHTVSSFLPLLPSIIANNAHKNNNTTSGYSANLTTHLLAIVHTIITWIHFPEDAIHYHIANLAYDGAFTNMCIAELKQSIHRKNIAQALASSEIIKTTPEPQLSQQKTIQNAIETAFIPILQTTCSIATTSENVKIRRIAQGLGTCIKLYTGYKTPINSANKRLLLLVLMITTLVLTYELFTLDQIITYKKESSEYSNPHRTIDTTSPTLSKKDATMPNSEEKDLCCRETNTDRQTSVERATQTNDFYLAPTRNLQNDFNETHINEPRKETASVPLRRLTPTFNRIIPADNRLKSPVADEEVARYTTELKNK